MKSPNEFKNIHNFPESGVIEIPEIVIASKSRSEAAVLPTDQSDQSNCQDNEDWDIKESVRSFGKESFCVFEEQSLEFSFGSPPTKHSKKNDGEEEANNCSEYF